MNENYQEGTKLIVELRDGEVYEGDLFSKDDLRLSLINVSQYPSEVQLPYPYHFYQEEIVSLRAFKNETEEYDDNKTNANTKYPITDSHLAKCKALFTKYKYFWSVDEKYHKALKILKSSDIVSVVAVGSNYGREGAISFITFSTKNKIFIFDVQRGGTSIFDEGLNEILGADDILKVVHNSKLLADCFQNVYKIKLNYVFDTQIADYMILKKESLVHPNNFRKFSECVHSYLNLPKSVVDWFEFTGKEMNERPISENTMKYYSMLALYLLAIKRVMEYRMMDKFYNCVESYVNLTMNEKPVTAREMNNDIVPNIIKELSDLSL